MNNPVGINKIRRYHNFSSFLVDIRRSSYTLLPVRFDDDLDGFFCLGNHFETRCRFGKS